jgi:hypothetical protein
MIPSINQSINAAACSLFCLVSSFFLPPFYEAFLLSLFREESSASDMDWRKAKESLKGCSQAPQKGKKGQKDNKRIKAKRKKGTKGQPK